MINIDELRISFDLLLLLSVFLCLYIYGFIINTLLVYNQLDVDYIFNTMNYNKYVIT